MKKQDTPFYRLYSCVSPEGFILLFKGETPQTVAYILSFCPRKSYTKKVLQHLEAKQKDSKEQKIASVIREYLSRCKDNVYDIDLIHILEEQISIMTDGFKYYSGPHKWGLKKWHRE